jgi:glucosamine-6-phosphate deaminase
MVTIGIDVGGTKTHSVAFDRDAVPVVELRRRTAVGSPESVTAPIARAVEGPVMSMVSASALQLHPHVTVVLDELAAKNLINADYYYRETFRHKPSWQQL